MISSGHIIAYYIKAMLGSINTHREKGKQDICILSTRRSGSTLLQELIYSQNGFNYVDQPLDLWKYNPYKQLIPNTPLHIYIHLDEQQQFQLKTYFNNIVFKGKLRGYSQWNYFHKKYNFITDRFVVKILNVLPLIDWFYDTFNVKIIYFMRHPIPTSLSILQRDWGTVAEAFISNPHFVKSYLNERTISLSSHIFKKGTKLQKLVLEWCLYHLYPLSVYADREWLTITYEELVLRPKKMVELLGNYLDLPDRERMLETILKPSKTTSRRSKKDIFEKGPSYLVNRWKTKIDEKIESEAMSILEEFGIDAYKKGSTTPSAKLLHFGSIVDL